MYFLQKVFSYSGNPGKILQKYLWRTSFTVTLQSGEVNFYWQLTPSQHFYKDNASIFSNILFLKLSKQLSHINLCLLIICSFSLEWTDIWAGRRMGHSNFYFAIYKQVPCFYCSFLERKIKRALLHTTESLQNKTGVQISSNMLVFCLYFSLCKEEEVTSASRKRKREERIIPCESTLLICNLTHNEIIPSHHGNYHSTYSEWNYSIPSCLPTYIIHKILAISCNSLQYFWIRKISNQRVL